MTFQHHMIQRFSRHINQNIFWGPVKTRYFLSLNAFSHKVICCVNILSLWMILSVFWPELQLLSCTHGEGLLKEDKDWVQLKVFEPHTLSARVRESFILCLGSGERDRSLFVWPPWDWVDKIIKGLANSRTLVVTIFYPIRVRVSTYIRILT